MDTKEQHDLIQEQYNTGTRVFLIDEDGHYLGQPDLTRWNNAKPYQRFLGRIFKRYKDKFIDVEGFSISNCTSPIEWKESEVTSSFDVIKSEIIGYRCGHCGRTFKQKVPHKCNGMYRKKNMNFIPMY